MISRFKRLIPTQINHGNLCMTRLRSYSEIERILSTKDLFFVCSTGREGSSFISSFIEENEHILNEHEPRPFCNGQQLITECQKYGNSAGVNHIQRKWSTIAGVMERSSASAYIEGNHMFQKTFGKALLKELNLRVNVVSMRRPILNTAKSFLDLQWFSSMSGRASNWVYKVSDTSPICRGSLSLLTELDEIFAYIISEKVNEVNFISQLGEKLESYNRVNIPATNSELLNLANLINPCASIATAPLQNDRTTQKQANAPFERIQVEYHDFLVRNRVSLEDQGINVDSASLEIVIKQELWPALLK